MPETKTTESMLRVSRLIKAPREKVYNAFTDPKLLAKWYNPTPMGTTVHRWDAKTSGQFHITMKTPDGDHTARGTFQEVIPGQKLTQTWAWDGDDPEMAAKGSILTVELKDASGGTEVILTHERLPTKRSVEMHTQGWTGCLENLAALF